MFKIDTANNVARFVQANESALIPIKNGSNWNVRCPICNDKFKRYSLRRGYFLYKNGQHNYYCHNDGCECNTSAFSFNRFLRTFFPDFHQQLKTEALLMKGVEKKIDYNGIVEVSKNPKKDYEGILTFPEAGDLGVIAEKYCKDRLIPEHIYKTWFVAVSGKYKDRLIIPFRDSNDRIKYFQGRHLLGKNPKYLNKMGDKYVYNVDFVDKSKTVFAFEGVFDSLHAENSVAVLGLGDDDMLIGLRQRFPKLCFVLDNDKAGRNTTKDLMSKGYRVFIWKDFVNDMKLPFRDKWDFNEVVKTKFGKYHQFSVEDMSKYISRSYFDIHKI